MEEGVEGNRFRRLFVCIPTALDRWWRYRDFYFNRSYGGWMRKLGLDGHSPVAFLWPMMLLLFLVYGPTLGWRGWPAVFLVLGGRAVLYAAAPHANFPPVFSDAPIDDVKTGNRYWVTDGGAVENRGLISLLFLLRGVLERLEAQGPPTHLPEIHVVMAEASAGSRRYSQDRGVGTAFGATGKGASQLARELLEEARQIYGRICLGDPADPDRSCGKIVYHDLPMPDFLRTDSGRVPIG